MGVVRRRVPRAVRPGVPEVIEIPVEDLPAMRDGEALVDLEAVGLNHAGTLIRSGSNVVRVPFPYPVGGEGSGMIPADHLTDEKRRAILPLGGIGIR